MFAKILDLKEYLKLFIDPQEKINLFPTRIF